MAARRRLKKEFDEISTMTGVSHELEQGVGWRRAFQLMKEGKRVRRKGWAKIVLWIGIEKDQFPRPHFTMCCFDHRFDEERRSKWCPYYTDFEAQDWQEV